MSVTKLLDTGYLETDDPVLGSCFLERMIEGATGRSRILKRVGSELCVGMNGDLLAYPIRIPASTVAEVWGDQPGLRLRHGVILAALDETSRDSDIHETVLQWMDYHTQETPDEPEK